MLSVFFFSSRRRHTRCSRDWSSDVCSSDLSSPGSKKRSENSGGSEKSGMRSRSLRTITTRVFCAALMRFLNDFPAGFMSTTAVVEVIIQPTKEAASALVARMVANDLRANPHLLLGLATGATMELVYQRLARMHKEDKLDFSLCTTFNLDEYVGLPPSDPHSYRHYMEEHLFRH